nr:DUF4097 family beta strand repeat-containing protein [Spelaeicoccus albus]
MLMGGQVDVIAHDEKVARIEVSDIHGEPVRIESVDGLLSIKHPNVRWDNFWEKFRTFRSKESAVISIAVPRGITVSVSTVSADGLVSEAAGKCSIATVSGSLVADALRGDLKANTVSGELTIRHLSGTLNANAVSGEITASGEITDLKANTVDGDLMFDLFNPAGTLRSNSVSGAMTMRIPPESDVELKANSAGGTVMIDGERYRAGVGSGVSRAATGDPRWTVAANSASGDVTVLRQEGEK